ncbi:MAG: Flp pilus assembly protein CpaB, partial [Deltaproteobacteria bacterium]|nr:Flp pilus assembly protein CpaB [Deltaproteobacteria bacterium]
MRRPVIFVLLAGFAALVAAMVVYSALKKREAEVQQAKLQSVDIIVAAHPLGIGTKLDATSVKSVRWSRDSLPPGSYTDVGEIVNKYTKSSFVENEPIVSDRLFTGDKNAGVMPLLIPAGMRALSVQVDEVSDIAGFIMPHARVDVLVTATSGDKPVSKIVLQNVEVLAIAQDIEQVNDKPQPVHVVTMLVTPDQAERLTLASGQGGLRLALRNYEDKTIIATNGVTVSQLLNEQPAPVPISIQGRVVYATRPRPKPVNVEVLRNGTSTESVSFIRSGGGRNPSMEQAAPEPPPPPDNGAPGETSNGFSMVGSTGSTASDSTSSAPSGGSTLGDLASHASGDTAAGEPVLMNPAAGAASSAAPAPEFPYNGPRAKTIDVP